MLRNKLLVFVSPFVLSAALLSTTNIMAMEEDPTGDYCPRHANAKLDVQRELTAPILPLSAEQTPDLFFKRLQADLFLERDEKASQDSLQVAIWNNREALFPPKWDDASCTALAQLLRGYGYNSEDEHRSKKIAYIANLLSMTIYNYDKEPYAESTFFCGTMYEYVDNLVNCSEERLKVISTQANKLFSKDWYTISHNSLVCSLRETYPERIPHIASLLSRGTCTDYQGRKIPYTESPYFDSNMKRFIQQFRALSHEHLKAVATYATLIFPHGWEFAQVVQVIQNISKLTPQELEAFVNLTPQEFEVFLKQANKVERVWKE